MRHLILLLSLLLPIHSLIALKINKTHLREKIEHPPQWALDQIESDLTLYKNKITTSDLEKVYADYKNHPNLFKIKIENNIVIPDTKTDCDHRYKYKKTYKFLQSCTKHVQFPNIEFLICTSDNFSPKKPLACPVFVSCTMKKSYSAVLFPQARKLDSKYQLTKKILNIKEPIPWENKTEVAFWRGATTGGGYESGKNLRLKIVRLSEKYPNEIDAGFTRIYPASKKWLIENIILRNHVSPIDQMKYKYLIALDGYSFSSSLHWQLLTGSTVLKSSSDYVEWFYKAIKPNVHYISFNKDCSDLVKKIKWAKSHDSKVKRMAKNAREFYLNNLMIEDIIAYFYHLFNAYAKLQTPDTPETDRPTSPQEEAPEPILSQSF